MNPMSESNSLPDPHLPPPSHPVPPRLTPPRRTSKPAKITLWGEIKKGWEWVIFCWTMIHRLGGFRQITYSLFLTISLLVKRMLVQWGVIQKKN